MHIARPPRIAGKLESWSKYGKVTRKDKTTPALSSVISSCVTPPPPLTLGTLTHQIKQQNETLLEETHINACTTS
jgi:hypothetical protein